MGEDLCLSQYTQFIYFATLTLKQTSYGSCTGKCNTESGLKPYLI